MAKKVAIIGAGSKSFPASTLVANLAKVEGYHDAIFALVDPGVEGLAISEKLIRRVVDHLDLSVKIETYTDSAQALPGADLVTVAIAIGGLDAVVKDFDIPAEHGYVQSLADTSGPGAISKAMRYAPVMQKIGQQILNLCPNARVYNFTNPLTAMCGILSMNNQLEVYGLCDGSLYTKKWLCDYLQEPRDAITVHAAGLNHLHWALTFSKDGEDLYPRFAEKVASGDHDNQPWRWEALSIALFEQYGRYPGPGDIHLVEFFPQMINQFEGYAESYDRYYLGNHHPKHLKLAASTKAQAMGEEPLQEGSLTQKGAEMIAEVEAGFVSDEPVACQLNYLNQGALVGLPDEIIVEGPVKVSKNGITPMSFEFSPEILAVLKNHADRNLAIMDAAINQDVAAAIEAFTLDPYCSDEAIGRECLTSILG